MVRARGFCVEITIPRTVKSSLRLTLSCGNEAQEAELEPSMLGSRTHVILSSAAVSSTVQLHVNEEGKVIIRNITLTVKEQSFILALASGGNVTFKLIDVNTWKQREEANLEADLQRERHLHRRHMGGIPSPEEIEGHPSAAVFHVLKQSQQLYEQAKEDMQLKNLVATLLGEMVEQDHEASQASGKISKMGRSVDEFVAAIATLPKSFPEELKAFMPKLSRQLIVRYFWSVVRNGVHSDTRFLLWICCCGLPPSASRDTLFSATSHAFTTDKNEIEKTIVKLAMM